MKDHTPRKRFGQNFLVATDVIAQILSAIAPQPDDALIEIGPGLGALTAPLLNKPKYLHVVEIDRDLIARLRAHFPATRLTIHEGDHDMAVLGANAFIDNKDVAIEYLGAFH